MVIYRHVDFSSLRAKELGEFLAVLVRERVDYEVKTVIDGWRVTITSSI
jgi:hypothetical protein